MNLPGSPRLHVWVGLLLALVGVLVGGYAYTSWRIYFLHYLPIALVGLVLLIGGSALAGYGQANRPRLGGRGASEKPGLLDRLSTAIVGLSGSDADEEVEEETDESEDDEAAGEADEPEEATEEADEGEGTVDGGDEDEGTVDGDDGDEASRGGEAPDDDEGTAGEDASEGDDGSPREA